MAMTESPPAPTDTQPNHPIILRKKPRGCTFILLILLFLLALVPVFLCGMSLVVYLVFPPPQTNILIMGLDAREGEGFLSRSDSIMLVGITPAKFQVNLLSIPRDLFIDVPNYGSQRINTINMLAEMEIPGSGPELLADSIAQDFDVHVDRYVRLNFDMFVDLIDAVGGVTIYVERVIIDDAYPTPDGGVITVRFESGLQTMDGERALIYARIRHGSDDYQRAERQQQVVSALTKKLSNPSCWPAMFDVISRSTDTNLTLWDMVTLAPPVLLSGGRFDHLVINRDYILGTAQGHAVPNYDLINPWVQSRFN
jgi:LCP family protein required for cell wall assembly